MMLSLCHIVMTPTDASTNIAEKISRQIAFGDSLLDGEKREHDAGFFAVKEDAGDGVAVDGVVFRHGVVSEKRSDAVAESGGRR